MGRMGKIEKLIESTVYKCPMPEGFEPGPEYRPHPPQRKSGYKNYKGKGGRKPYRPKK